MPSRVAGTTPRSVMIAVTSSAGVMSNAGLAAGVAPATICTAPTPPAGVAPTTVRSSSPDRSSIGIDVPSGQSWSMVLHGAATRNGTPWARAASAFR